MKFTKMEGIGNDYVYVNCLEKELENPSEIAIKVSDRHFGIGSDGLILICKSNIADFKMEIYNSDGSQAEMCGNGIRCVGKYVYDNNLTNKTELTIETLAGIKKLKLNLAEGKVDTVEVDMGEPILEAEKIPVQNTILSKASEADIEQNKITTQSLEKEYNKVNVKALDKEFNLTCVSMGNPHAISYVQNVDDFEVEKYGPIIEKDEHFPRKVNVEFIELIDRNHLKMRVWERGAGETLACGTGTCASVVASCLNGLTDRCVNVKLLGGNLKIEWRKTDNHVYMTGPARTVFTGEIDV